MQNHLLRRILEEIMKVASRKINFEPLSANTKHQKRCSFGTQRLSFLWISMICQGRDKNQLLDYLSAVASKTALEWL